MAKYQNNLIIGGMIGFIGKQFILKKYKSDTFLSKYPDMSKVVPLQNNFLQNKNLRKQ